MITPLFMLLITLSTAGATAPIILEDQFDPFANGFREIMTPMTQESLDILAEYTEFRNTYPWHLSLNNSATVIAPDDDTHIGQVQDGSLLLDLPATEGSITIISQDNTVSKPVSITCTGTTIIDILPEKTVILCN